MSRLAFSSLSAVAALLLALALGWNPPRAAAAIIWTNADADDQWSNDNNWDPNTGLMVPSDVRTAVFNTTATGLSVMNLPGQSVGGLNYVHGNHQLDLDGNTLTVSAGGQVHMTNSIGALTPQASTLTITNGTLQIGIDASSRASEMILARQPDNDGSRNFSATFTTGSGAALTAYLDRLTIGQHGTDGGGSNSGGSGNASMVLGADDRLTVTDLHIARGNRSTASLTIGHADVFEDVTNLHVGWHEKSNSGIANGTLTVLAGDVDWSFNELHVGRNTGSTGAHAHGTLDFSNSSSVHLHATTMSLARGEILTAPGASLLLTSDGDIHIGGASGGPGNFTLTAPVGGTLQIGMGTDPGERVNLHVGFRDSAPSGTAQGELNDSGGLVTAYVNDLFVGNSPVSGGVGAGTIDLSNNLASSIDVGGTVHVGKGNGALGTLILADSSQLAGDYLTSGTRTLRVGVHDHSSSSATHGTVEIRGGTIAWNLAELTLGGHLSSSVSDSTGTLDFSEISTDMAIRAATMNLWDGQMILPAGRNMTLTGDALLIGGGNRNADFTLSPADGATLFVGTVADRWNTLRVGLNTDTNGFAEGELNDAGGVVQAYATQLIIGDHTTSSGSNAPPRVAGRVILANGASFINVEEAVYVGRGNRGDGSLTLASGDQLVFTGPFSHELQIGWHNLSSTNTNFGTMVVEGGTVSWDLALLSVGRSTVANGSGDGSLDMSGATLNDMTVGTFLVGTGGDDSRGHVELGPGTLHVGTLNIGVGDNGESSFETDRTTVNVANSLTIGDNDSALTVIDGGSGGFSLAEGALFDIASGGNLELRFGDPDFDVSPDNPWWGFRWQFDPDVLEEGHVATLEALLNVGNYTGSGAITASFFGTEAGGLYANPDLLVVSNYIDEFGNSFSFIGFDIQIIIPEPSTAGLLGMGLLALMLRRRRRRAGLAG